MDMSSKIQDLQAAIRNGREYFSSGDPMDVAYIKYTLRDVLRDAVNAVKSEFIHDHEANTNSSALVVHYTSLGTLFSMLHGGAEPLHRERSVATGSTTREDADASSEPAPTTSLNEAGASTTAHKNDAAPTDRRYLRLYDCANLNDPSEGIYFLRALVNPEDTLGILDHVVHIPAYITSFVTSQPNATPPKYNNLVFWRHYGQEGRGCSIAIPVKRFAPDQCAAKLQKVIYDPDKTTTNARRLRPILECLGCISAASQEDRQPAIRRLLAAMLLDYLGEIPYLYKSSAYAHEEECRIVAMECDLRNHGGIYYDFVARPRGPDLLRMYGQHPCLCLTNILATDTVITLGPSIPNKDYVQYAIEHLLRSIGITGLKIEQSEIPYRQL